MFKFLKDGMGWEDIQIQDFQGIQNLLSICFFLAAYLYEIKEQEVHDDFIILRLFSKIYGSMVAPQVYQAGDRALSASNPVF